MLFSTTLPACADANGPAILHGSRLKVRLTLNDGHAVDRLPAWVRHAVVPAGELGAKFDGVHWAPPPHERHQWWVLPQNHQHCSVSGKTESIRVQRRALGTEVLRAAPIVRLLPLP